MKLTGTLNYTQEQAQNLYSEMYECDHSVSTTRSNSSPKNEYGTPTDLVAQIYGDVAKKTDKILEDMQNN